MYTLAIAVSQGSGQIGCDRLPIIYVDYFSIYPSMYAAP
jgi:hypothetical protein